MMEDSGEKLSDDDKAPVNEKLDELEGLIMNEGQPIDFEELDEAAIQAKMAELEEVMHGVSTKLYEAAAAEMAEQQAANEAAADSDDVVEADFEVVDSDDGDE